MWQCLECKLIPADQDKIHRYITHPGWNVFARCNRCGASQWVNTDYAKAIWTFTFKV